MAFFFLSLALPQSKFITWHELNEMQPNRWLMNIFTKLWSLATPSVALIQQDNISVTGDWLVL